MERERAATAAQLGSAAKENMPPKMSKATMSVNSLFTQGDRLRKKNEDARRDVLAPRAAGISKPGPVKEGFFAKFHKPKAPEHSVYADFKKTLAEYRQGAEAGRADGLQPIYEELINRVDGLDVHSRPLHIANVPNQADIDALIAAEDELYKPLDDDVLQLRNQQGNVRDVRLGDSIRNFEIKSEKKRSELVGLQEQLKIVNAELAAAQQEAIRSEEVEVKQLRKKLAVQLDGFKDRALKIKEQTLAEVKAAEKEDKRAKKEWDAKIAALTE